MLTQINEITQLTDFTAGRRAWQACIDLAECTSEEMRRGWQHQDNLSAWADYHQGELERREEARVRTASEELADELAAMDEVVKAMRAGAGEVVRLTPEQLDEIEDERPGEEYCRVPWNY